MDGVGRVPRVWGGHVEVVRRVCGGCLEGVGRLSEVYGKAVWKMWGGCLEGMGRLSGGCGEAVWKV